MTVDTVDKGLTLVEFLARRLSISHRHAKRMLDTRNVFVNRRRVWMAHHMVEHGQIVEAPAATEDGRRPVERTIRIVWENERYLVADKLPGLLSNGESSVESLLRRQTGSADLRAAHRLDRDTSGCLILARSTADFDRLVPEFRNRRVTKQYHAIVRGRLTTEGLTLNTPIEGEPALTHVRVLDYGAAATHLLARIETGRTHQIRRHLAGIGHPVIGDRRYATRLPAFSEAALVERHMLHASDISLRDPFDGSPIRAHIEPPADFRRCLRAFGLS